LYFSNITVANISQEFYPQDGGESQLASKLRHCHPIRIQAQESQTHVESGLIFLVDDESNFAERRRRLRMVAFAELVALVEHAAGDHVGREVQKTRSDRRKGDSLQPARVRLR